MSKWSYKLVHLKKNLSSMRFVLGVSIEYVLSLLWKVTSWWMKLQTLLLLVQLPVSQKFSSSHLSWIAVSSEDRKWNKSKITLSKSLQQKNSTENIFINSKVNQLGALYFNNFEQTRYISW